MGGSDDIRLKEVDFFDVSQVPIEIFAEAAVKLEYFSTECSYPIPGHVNALFRKIAQTEEIKLKELSMNQMDEDVPADILSEAAIKLERFNFFVQNTFG